METKPKQRSKGCWVKGYVGFSYLLTPTQERFMKHMVDIQRQRDAGYKADYTRAEYMEMMDLKEFSFDSCAKSLLEMGLITRLAESSRNRVFYLLNHENFERLVDLVSATSNRTRLARYIHRNLKKLGRKISDITDEEIELLGL